MFLTQNTVYTVYYQLFIQKHKIISHLSEVLFLLKEFNSGLYVQTFLRIDIVIIVQRYVSEMPKVLF